MDATIKNLNEKLSTCTDRLKELENANHKLGRDAYRRSQCFTGSTNMKEEDPHGLNELRSQNKVLQVSSVPPKLLMSIIQYARKKNWVLILNFRSGNKEFSVVWSFSEVSEK